jgi:hypothetical protein
MSHSILFVGAIHAKMHTRNVGRWMLNIELEDKRSARLPAIHNTPSQCPLSIYSRVTLVKLLIELILVSIFSFSVGHCANNNIPYSAILDSPSLQHETKAKHDAEAAERKTQPASQTAIVNAAQG